MATRTPDESATGKNGVDTSDSEFPECVRSGIYWRQYKVSKYPPLPHLINYLHNDTLTQSQIQYLVAYE
jgi:hypothetical protein